MDVSTLLSPIKVKTRFRSPAPLSWETQNAYYSPSHLVEDSFLLAFRKCLDRSARIVYGLRPGKSRIFSNSGRIFQPPQQGEFRAAVRRGFRSGSDCYCCWRGWKHDGPGPSSTDRRSNKWGTSDGRCHANDLSPDPVWIKVCLLKSEGF